MDSSNAGRNSPSYFNDYSTGYQCQRYHETYEDPYNPHFFEQHGMQNYQGHSAFDPVNNGRDIHSGHDQRGPRSFRRGQRQNYRGNFTTGKSSRLENGSANANDDGTLGVRRAVSGQVDDAWSELREEPADDASEAKARDFSGGNDIHRKQMDKKKNKSFDNLCGTERSGSTNWRNKQDGCYGQSYDAHERKNGFQQRGSWSRSSNNELEVRQASNFYENDYHGRGGNRGRRKPKNYFKERDNENENWGSRSENKDPMIDYGEIYSDDREAAKIKEEHLLSLPASKLDVDSRQLEIPVDSCSNSSSSRSSANRHESGIKAKSHSFRDTNRHSEQDIEKSDRHNGKDVIRPNGCYDFPQREGNSQEDRNVNRRYERNENSREEIRRNCISGHDKNSFVGEKQTKGENDREKNKTTWNSNGNQRQQRRNYETESRNSTIRHKQNWQDRNTEYAAYKYKNLDNRPRSDFCSDEKVAVNVSDERHGPLDKPKHLNSQMTGEADDRSNPGSRNTEAVSSKVKDSSVAVKSFNQHPKKPSSVQRRDLPQASKWQDETQRGLLMEHLSAEKYECLVCCNVIRRETAIWSCTNCYHIYHMYCIKKWAQCPAATASPEAMGSGWRCPTCQNPYLQVPSQYTCFCGKMKDPEFNRYTTPHSCDEMCGKECSRGCPHLCNILCHPGPCPPCSAFIVRSCDCGKTKRSVKCAGDATKFKCTDQCHRALNCGSHECQSFCHAGSCEPCGVVIEQRCYCEQDTRTVLCGSAESFVKMFSCSNICSRKLSCGEHTCGDICHPGPCTECPLTPSKVTHCPCGKTLLTEIPSSKPRETCLDSISTCAKACGKELRCGNGGGKHRCKQVCHRGPCTATCGGTTEVTCRCGTVTEELPCADFLKITESSPFICGRRCKKKMSCGRHKCSQLCCVSTEHQCQLLCGYRLSCGLHRCEEPCHRGNCPSCWQVSFDELRCHCGAEVLYPPVSCGAKPPECHRPCTRQHPCSHQATHHCHSENTCPPCTVLTQKWCLGHHEIRCNIPCYVAEISCGMQCGKELPCVIHKCLQPCHKGPCLEDQTCTQPCPMIREKCGHPCQAPCHQGSPCPATSCRAEITLQCECGRRKERGQCLCGNDTGSQSDYTKMTAQYVASKLWEGQSIDLSVLTKEVGASKKTRKLQCNSECSIMERNQRLALALEIKNPDLSSKLGNPPYSQFLKDFAKQNSTFVANVEKALSSLVTASQQVKVNRKSHAFKVMPSTQRRVIHELAEFYGCQTESYDEEPNKNVVATAVKGKCWLPNVTLTSLVQRELFPKAPIPIPINCKEEQIRSAAQGAKQSTEVLGTAKMQGGNPRRQKEAQIDYFDITD